MEKRYTITKEFVFADCLVTPSGGAITGDIDLPSAKRHGTMSRPICTNTSE